MARILVVANRQFREMGHQAIRALGKAQHMLFDLKYVLPAYVSGLRL